MRAGGRGWLAAALGLTAVLAASPSRAAVDRYAVLVGNNLGARDEARLRFAETDASKLHDALKELGSFPPENMILLRGDNPATVRSAIIATNDRVRSSVAAGRQAVLLVYYSGHADAEALHLGDEDLPLRELEQLARGSAATLRLLVLDACRSGSVTRGKGGVRAEPFPVRVEQRLAGEGAIFLTSSTVNEESQESDAISGSFFTHYLVSGLLGAADHNGDGQVSLEEAYRFTYDNTVRASSRTLAGMQHPSFRFELSGHGGFVLTTPFRGGGRAQVHFPQNITFLVVQGDEDGAVVAEIGTTDRTRRLSLKAGRYFVRGRTAHYLLEGTLHLAANQTAVVDEQRLTRVEYARLVRKGGGGGHAFSVEAGYQATEAIWSGASLCHGAFGGPTLTLPRLTLGLRLGFCRGRHQRGEGGLARGFEAVLDQFDLGLRASMVWDLHRVSLGVGLGAGGLVLHQHFVTAGEAPRRWTAAGNVGAFARLSASITPRTFAFAELALDTLFLRRDQSPTGPSSVGATVIGRAFAGAGVHF